MTSILADLRAVVEQVQTATQLVLDLLNKAPRT